MVINKYTCDVLKVLEIAQAFRQVQLIWGLSKQTKNNNKETKNNKIKQKRVSTF